MADIFRHRGPAWRASDAGHLSLGQLKVMSAIERCRTWAFSPRARPVGALGGHVERCEDCAHLRISYNSCGNRHCPKCQAAAAKEWLADRQAELLPVPYFHVVFTLPGPIADIAYHNQAVVYDLLLKTAAETLITIAADPKHLGARIGLTACSTPGGRHSPTIRMPTSSSREAASLPMASAGSPAGSAFSSPFRSSPGSSVACSSKG